MPFGWPWSSFFLLQYFDCLPTKLDTWCCHSIWKMISASRRVFWDGFQPFLKNTWFSVSFSSLQYFDCLPIEQDTWCRHSIWKMISASRRIFWDGFQRCLKKCRSSASVLSIVSHRFSNQNKLWNMLQAAFGHEESFFNTPKAWKASFRRVLDDLTFKIQHLFL